MFTTCNFKLLTPSKCLGCHSVWSSDCVYSSDSYTLQLKGIQRASSSFTKRSLDSLVATRSYVDQILKHLNGLNQRNPQNLHGWQKGLLRVEIGSRTRGQHAIFEAVSLIKSSRTCGFFPILCVKISKGKNLGTAQFCRCFVWHQPICKQASRSSFPNHFGGLIDLLIQKQGKDATRTSRVKSVWM